MNKKPKDLSAEADKYRQALLHDTLPFWIKHSLDQEYGGYFTCLDRKGKVYDTDKFIWLQCRQVWLFAMMYNRVSSDPQWLDIALLGATFLEKHGMDKHGHWYFSLTRDGRPLVQPYNIFSDCFAAIAFGQLSKATGKEAYAKIAKQTFQHVLKRRHNPKGMYNKLYPGTRPVKSFALPMILSNLVLEIEHLIEDSLLEETLAYSVHEVMEVFYRQDLGVILENVAIDGHLVDSFDGRLICPGHGLEAMWFLLDIGDRNKDKILMQKATEIALKLMDYGWDDQYGGLFYFMDSQGSPLDRLDWDQKLWWVHQEAMLAMLKGFAYTKDDRCWDWYVRLADYSWSHFSDSKYGEWFGYLNRNGEVLLPLKGGKWKGCFHTPRFLYQGWKTLEIIQTQQSLPM